MKRTTLIVLGVFLVLLALWIGLRSGGEPPADHRLEVAPVRSGDGARDDEPEGAKGPPDRLEVVRRGVRVVLAREGDDWQVLEPAPGGAQAFRVRSMVSAFREGIETSLGREVAEEDLGVYGLAEDRRIHVRMLQGGEVLVDLWIGDAEKVDENGTRDTSVMEPGSGVVFRVRGQDLRTPFDMDLDELQDKKVFRFAREDVSRLVIQDPRDREHPRYVLVRTGEGTGDDAWSFEEPAGFRPGGVGSYVSTLVSLAAVRFAEALPGAEAEALDRTYRIAVTVKEGGKTREETLELGAGRGAVWARVAGRGGVLQVSKGSSESLMKGLSDLRDKKLFTFKAEEVRRLSLEEKAGTAMVLDHTPEGWRFESPAGVEASTTAVERLVSSLVALRTQEYLKGPAEGTGLEEPAFVLRVTVGEGEKAAVHVLQVGAEKTGGDDKAQKRFWARLEGSDELLELADYSLNTLRKSVTDLEDTRVFRIRADEISGLRIAYPDQVLELSKTDGGTWKLVAPEALDSPRGVDVIVNTLADLPLKTADTGKTPDEARLQVEYTITLTEGAPQVLKLSEEVVDGGNYAQAPGLSRLGDKVFTVSQYKAANLLKKLPDFKPGTSPAAP